MAVLRREPFLIALAVVVAGVVLLPAVHTPFRFDDTLSFEMRTGALDARGITFGSYFSDQVTSVFDSERISPLGVLLTVVPWAFSDAPELYKLYLIALALLAVALIARLLLALGAPARVTAALLVLGAGFAQFRLYHDSLLGYLGLYQWTLVLMAGALLAWLRHDDGRGRRWLAISVALWCACVTLYEANVALVAVAAAVVVARRRELRPIVAGIAPFLVPAIAVAAAALVARATGGDTGGEYEPGGGSGDLLRTWVVTVAGALPPSYALWDPAGLMGDFTAAELAAGAWRGIVVGAAAWIGAAAGPGRWRGPAALVGIALWLFPSVTLAVAPKYQDELDFGMAYLPALAQSTGVAILALAALAGVRRLALRAAGVAVVAVAAAATGTANLRVVASEWPTKRTRELMYDGLRHGVANAIPAGGTIVGHLRDLNWYPTNFAQDKSTFDGVAADRSGRRYDMRVDRFIPAPSCRERVDEWPRPACAPVSAVGGWLAVRPVRGGGAAVMAASARGRVADAFGPATGFTAYLEDDLAAQGPPVVLGTLVDRRPWSSEGLVDWRRERTGDGWALWTGKLRAGAEAPIVGSIDISGGQINFVDPVRAPKWVRQLGTRPLLP